MPKASNVSILIASPCFGSQMHSFTAGALFSAAQLLAKKHILTDIITPSGESFLPVVRNKIADTFLRSVGFTHLMCIDADILFDPNDILTLVDMSVDFAAAKYRLKKNEVEYCLPKNKYSDKDTITEVDYVGAGFKLLSRNCFGKLIKSGTISKSKGVNGVDIWDFYSPIIKDGFLLPEDISFCKRWTGIDEKIYVNNNIKLGHYGGVIY